MPILKILIRRRVYRCLIRVYTVCLCPSYGLLGINEVTLKATTTTAADDIHKYSKNVGGVTILVFCTWSDIFTKFHEIISKGVCVIKRTRNHDGRTDGQTDGQGDYYRASVDFVWRGPNYCGIFK